MERYFKHKINSLLVINKIVTIHYFEHGKNYNFAGESHDFWEIVYADKNGFYDMQYGEKVYVSEGEMIFHKPNEFHCVIADGKKPLNIFVITFECKSDAMNFFNDKKIALDNGLVKDIYEIISIAKQTFNIPYSDPDLKKLELLPTPTLGGEQLIKNALESLLINIMRKLTEKQGQNQVFILGKDIGNKLVDDIVNLLKNSINDNLTIEDICKAVNYSKPYVCKTFKNYIGKGVIEYYNSLKIEKAKELLRENELTIREISETLCFDTPNYFSKTFKRFTNVTPMEYKTRKNFIG